LQRWRKKGIYWSLATTSAIWLVGSRKTTTAIDIIIGMIIITTGMIWR
jgi:hypothetical protein